MTDTAIVLVNALDTSRIDYCNAVLDGVYGVHMRQLHGVLNAAARLIVRKSGRYVTSCIGYRFNNVSSINCAHLRSTVCTASHPSTCRPCANQSLRISAVAVYVRLHVKIWLFQPQGRGSTVPAALLWLDRLHGTPCQRHCATSH